MNSREKTFLVQNEDACRAFREGRIAEALRFWEEVDGEFAGFAAMQLAMAERGLNKYWRQSPYFWQRMEFAAANGFISGKLNLALREYQRDEQIWNLFKSNLVSTWGKINNIGNIKSKRPVDLSYEWPDKWKNYANIFVAYTITKKYVDGIGEPISFKISISANNIADFKLIMPFYLRLSGFIIVKIDKILEIDHDDISDDMRKSIIADIGQPNGTASYALWWEK